MRFIINYRARRAANTDAQCLGTERRYMYSKPLASTCIVNCIRM